MRRWCSLLWVFVCSIVASPDLSRERECDTGALLHEAGAALSTGDDAAAETHLRAALECDADSAVAYTMLSAVLHKMSRVHEAWTLLSDALARGVDGSNVLDNFGHLSFELERWDAAADAYGRAAARAPGSLSLRRLQGLALSHAGPQHLGAAAALLEAVRRAGAADVGTLFSLAKVYESLGRITDAGGVYNEMLTREPEHVGARLNIAALHHGFGNIEDALTQYRMLVARPLSEVPLDMMRMALTDYALALYERGECGEAVRLFERELALAGDDATREDVATTHAHVLRARRAVCDWSDADGLWRVLAAETREFLAAGNTTPVLPFETLLIEMPPRLRREIATRHALEWWRARVRTAPEGGGGGGGGDAAAAASGFAVPQRRQRQQRRCPDLVLGYMSYDWAAHPTAHMGEGNFVNRGACTRAVALSYGRDDGSEYRRRIEAAAEPFVNLAAASFEEAVAAIRGARIDVLFDMQGHTRGAREQILAARPAPIAVNYLVYPGTSGAPYIDYVVADAVVVPPEHAPGYTERLLLLPSMYQVNYYAPGTASLADAALRSVLDAAAGGGGGGGGARGVVRAAHGLPASPARVVFANMNKIDKLEPATFAVWMALLRRHAGSVLWLLEARHGERNLRAEAAAHGVHPSRLIFAARVPKGEHIARHVAADLFLDTFVYNAHSTAADALRGALPVLTRVGDAFAARVAANVLHGARLPAFTTHSSREFEDVAGRLTRGSALRHAQALLARALLLDGAIGAAGRPGRRSAAFGHLRAAEEGRAWGPVCAGAARTLPLFDAPQCTRDLERAARTAVELRVVCNCTRHVVVGSPCV